MADLRYGPRGYLREVKRWAISHVDMARARRHSPVLALFSPGKTGTTTLEAALSQAGRPPIKLHSLGPLRQQLAELRKNAGYVRTQHGFHAARVEAALASGRDFRFLTGVRDPIARTVSRAFQAPEIYGISPSCGPEAYFRWIRQELESDLDRGGSLSWYRLDYALPLQLKLEDLSFDRSKGLGEIEGPQSKSLIYRIDSLDACREDIEQFTDLRLSFAPQNVRSKTSTAQLYKNVRDNFRLPQTLVDEIYADPLMDVFFTDSARMDMVKRWQTA